MAWPAPTRTNVDDRLPVVLEDLLCLLEVFGSPADHDRQRGVLRTDDCSGDRRIDEGDTLARQPAGGLAADVRVAAGSIDPQRSLAEVRHQLFDDFVDFAARRQDGDDDLCRSALREVRSELRPVLAGMPFCLLARAVPDSDFVMFGEVARHWVTHGAKSDECDLHAFLRRRIICDRLRRTTAARANKRHRPSVPFECRPFWEIRRDPPARVAEREVASAIVHGGTPIRPLCRGWVRGGREAEGSRRISQRTKGALRPFVAVHAARFDVWMKTISQLRQSG